MSADIFFTQDSEHFQGHWIESKIKDSGTTYHYHSDELRLLNNLIKVHANKNKTINSYYTYYL